ncbi:hypothetical protein ABMA28_006815 [Loxostege sticticalis]|uniref:Peptidase S1 domain-containing protein n=1 Tax=Loxostege sticticalis TaxID=481309 RepID=A0ABD0TNK0_LOXSC
MKLLLLLWITCVVVKAIPGKQNKIVGGTEASVKEYPEVVSLLKSVWWWYQQECGGTILNSRSVLTQHIAFKNNSWRIRVGSTYHNSGGFVHNVGQIIYHGNYNKNTYDYDVAIVRSKTTIDFNELVKQGDIAGPSYIVEDFDPVWTVGWGRTSDGGSFPLGLQQVQVSVVNQDVCRQRYAQAGKIVTDNMVCAGLLDVGGRGSCEYDGGGPLFHNNVVVGITSWGRGCAQAFYPDVYTKVSRVSPWIQANA